MADPTFFTGENDPRGKLLVAARDRLRAARSLEQIIEIVRSTARAVTSADGVTFILREGELCHYVEEDAIGPLWKGRRFPMDACISGWAMIHGKTAAIPDIYADARLPHDAYRPTFVKSLVMASVGGGSAVAALGAYWAEERSFTAREIAAVESLAASVGEAMVTVKAA